MFKNDMIGVWGSMSTWSKWQLSLYDRYKQMVYRCERPNHPSYCHYGAIGIKNEFKSFSEYYETVRKDPLFDSFKRDPGAYQIDKDIKCGHGSNYSPSTVIIATVSQNQAEANKRNHVSKNFGSNNWTYNKKHKHVIVTFTDGTVREFSSLQDAGTFFNRTDKLIGMWVRGKVGFPKNVQSICYGDRS